MLLQGLVVCVRDSRQNKVATGQFVHCATEQEIFAALGLDYKEPWERNCFDVAHLRREAESPAEEAAVPKRKVKRKESNHSSFDSQGEDR